MGLFTAQLSLRRLAPLCRQLSTAYTAGLPVIQLLDLTARENKDARIKNILEQMGHDVRLGSTLTEAAQNQRQYLPPLFIQFLSAGEQGGKLDVILRDLGSYFEDRLAMKRQVISGMAYPMFLLTTAWFLGSFALRILHAAFANLSGRGGAQDFDLWAFFVDYAQFQAKVLLGASAVFVALVFLSRIGVFRYFWPTLITHIWPVSAVTRRMALARFFRCFSLLLGAGVPITQCVSQSAAAASNAYIERELLKAIPPIRDGATLSQAFRDAPLTPLAREMLLVGETSGNLEFQLQKVSEYHFQEAKHAIDIAIKAFNTLIMLVAAATIGYLIITFWMQYYGGLMDALGV